MLRFFVLRVGNDEKQKHFSREQIDHSYAGAKYLTELAADDNVKKCTDYDIRNTYSAQAFKTAGRLFEVIDNNAISKLGCGVSVLKKEFFSSEFGITAEGAEMELMIF